MAKKTLKQAVAQFKAKSRRKPAPKGVQPLWTRPDVFFGDQFTSVLGTVQLPVSAMEGDDTPGRKRQRSEAKRPAGGFYTVRQIAERWGVSDDEVRERFRREPGVIRLTDENASKKRKRTYVTLRIPEEVLQRVERRLSVEGGPS